MKIFDKIVTAVEQVVSVIKEAKDKALALIAGVGAIVGATNAEAAVSYSEATGFTGTFDLGPYYSAIGIVVGAIAVVAAIGLAIKTFKRVS